MKLTCNVIGNCEDMILNSPIMIQKGEMIEFNDSFYEVDNVVRFEFDSDGSLEGAILNLKKIDK